MRVAGHTVSAFAPSVQIFFAAAIDIFNLRAYVARPREQGLRTTLTKDMGQAMNRGHDMLVQLSNGFAPIDGACLAHGSDLA